MTKIPIARSIILMDHIGLRLPEYHQASPEKRYIHPRQRIRTKRFCWTDKAALPSKRQLKSPDHFRSNQGVRSLGLNTLFSLTPFVTDDGSMLLRPDLDILCAQHQHLPPNVLPVHAKLTHSKVPGMHIQPLTISSLGSTTCPLTTFLLVLNPHKSRAILR